MDQNTSTILTTALTSSVVAAVVSFVSNSIIQRTQFRNEYHKQLLAKRIAAYESVERVITSLMVNGTFDLKESGKETIKFKVNNILMSKENYDECFRIFIEAMNKSLWLSGATTRALKHINEELLLISDKLRFPDNGQKKSKTYEERATTYSFLQDLSAKLSELSGNLSRAVRSDLRDLHNIDNFVG